MVSMSPYLLEKIHLEIILVQFFDLESYAIFLQGRCLHG